jgi:hypothetical protein
MAKAIASGDGRLMQKAGLEAEIARLDRQRAAHVDDQHDIRRRLSHACQDEGEAIRRISAIEQDITRRIPTWGDAFILKLEGRSISERKIAGGSLLSRLRITLLARQAPESPVAVFAGFRLSCAVNRTLTGRGNSGQIVIHRSR